MERFLAPSTGWSVTDRVYGPINQPSAEEIEKIYENAADFPEELQTRLKAALTVIYALRLCQPDFFASAETEREIERAVGLAARQTIDNYPIFDSKQKLNEETKDLDDSATALFSVIDQIVEIGEFPSEVRGLGEAIVRHIHKHHQLGRKNLG